MNKQLRHIAIVMDGNGRWARQRRLPRHAGHQAGLKATRAVIQACVNRNIKALTLFAFSSENWKRPKKEVGLLMDLFFTALKKEIKNLNENNVRMVFIGDLSAFSKKLQNQIAQAEMSTSANTGLELRIAVNYGGRWDIVNAARELMQTVVRDDINPDEINEEMFARHISLADVPEPDLFIRTGGEQRISNFLLWQLAYTELYFTDTLWPDFSDESLADAMSDYATRQRRFGKTGEQVEGVEQNA